MIVDFVFYTYPQFLMVSCDYIA